MDYVISITETLSCLDQVEADSCNEALDKTRQRYEHGDIILDSEDFQGVVFQVERT